MNDDPRERFLARQLAEGTALAQDSDLLELTPSEGDPPQAYVARFRCKGLVLQDGDVHEANEFVVGIRFPDDYLLRANPMQVVRWLGPPTIFHPDISDLAPFISMGQLLPGTGLVEILCRVFAIISYQQASLREGEVMNPAACAWARQNCDRFPIDRRPLRAPGNRELGTQ